MTRCSGMFVWNKITVTHSCSFDDAVREAFRLFPNVPEIKEKQKKCLNLLLKRKDDLGLLPTKLEKSLIANLFKLSVDRPNSTHKLLPMEFV